MIRRILQLPVWGLLLILLAIVAIVLFIFSSLNPWNPLKYFGPPTTTIDTSQTAVVRQIRGLNRLETASYTIDKIITAQTVGNVFQNLLFGDKLLLIAHGTVTAGVDLESISAKDVIIRGHDLTISLPASQILTTTLDDNQTRVYDRQLGLLNRGQTDLESQARAAAKQQIKQAACEDGILQRAATEAIARLSQMYHLLNFQTVTINAPAGSC